MIARIPMPEHCTGIVNNSIAIFFKRVGHSAYIPNIEEGENAWLQRYYTSPGAARKATYKCLSCRLLSSSNTASHKVMLCFRGYINNSRNEVVVGQP